MHGDHVTLYDAEAVVENLDERGQAVGRARCAADDAVRLRIELVAVDADDEGANDATLDRRADDHALRARLQMRGRGFLRSEQARTLEHDLGAELPPVQLGRVPLGRHRNALVADPKRAILRPDRVGEVPVNRVPLEEMGQHLRAREVVDSDDLDVRTFRRDPSDTAPNASETIDSDFRGHSLDSLFAAAPSQCAADERGT
jgi:hypothetical protein